MKRWLCRNDTPGQTTPSCRRTPPLAADSAGAGRQTTLGPTSCARQPMNRFTPLSSLADSDDCATGKPGGRPCCAVLDRGPAWLGQCRTRHLAMDGARQPSVDTRPARNSGVQRSAESTSRSHLQSPAALRPSTGGGETSQRWLQYIRPTRSEQCLNGRAKSTCHRRTAAPDLPATPTATGRGGSLCRHPGHDRTGHRIATTGTSAVPAGRQTD